MGFVVTSASLVFILIPSESVDPTADGKCVDP